LQVNESKSSYFIHNISIKKIKYSVEPVSLLLIISFCWFISQ
jgi:hypothetical protein